MDEPSQLDLAHKRMSADESDAVARLAFYERVVDTEFLMLLARESNGDAVEPALFTMDGQQFALLFDREQRLAAFSQAIVPYVALSGRACVKMLTGRDIGMGINLGVATSNSLLQPKVVDWLDEILSKEISKGVGRPVAVDRPNTISPLILSALDTKLALAWGLASYAYLVSATYSDNTTGLLLGIIGAVDGSKSALTNAVSEALIFSGLGEAAIDVTFLEGSEAICQKMAKIGFRFDLPALELASGQRAAPGMDPAKPPKLL